MLMYYAIGSIQEGKVSPTWLIRTVAIEEPG